MSTEPNPLYEWVLKQLAAQGKKIEDYPKDKHGRYVLPIVKPRP